jgi:hypothetical protein
VEKRALVKFADGSLDEFTVSEYDPSDITLLNQNRFSASKALMDQTEFTYNEAKKVLSTKMTKDEENRLKSRIVYEHKDARTTKPTKETTLNKAGKIVGSNEYTYNASGDVVSRSILNANNTKLAETSYTYSDHLLVSSETTDSRTGKRISSSTNEYDRDGNLVKQEFKNGDGAVTRRIATVWQNGLEMETIQTAPDGRPQLRITNKYGSSGEVLKRTVENYQGNSVQLMEFEYDEFRSNRGRT